MSSARSKSSEWSMAILSSDRLCLPSLFILFHRFDCALVHLYRARSGLPSSAPGAGATAAAPPSAADADAVAGGK